MSSGHSYFGHGLPFSKATAVPQFTGYTSTRIPAHFQGHAMPLQFQTGFPPLQAQHGTAPLDVMAQRARTPCKHFEHHLGWCPYGMKCHFLHNYARLRSRANSVGGSSDNSVSSSPRDSPVPAGPYYPARGGAANPYAYANTITAAAPIIPRHGFTPRTVGGTTYFPIRLDAVRLGFVTPIGVEVFTDH